MPTVLILATVALVLIGTALSTWWTGYEATANALVARKAVYVGQSDIEYGIFWMEQDPQATGLNSSTQTATVTAPAPLGTSTTLTLEDPIRSVTIQGPSSITTSEGAVLAFSAEAFDAQGNEVPTTGLTLNWQATGSGAGTWVGPGELSLTQSGSLSVTLPTVTTTDGQSISVSSNTISLTVDPGSTGQGQNLTVYPTQAALPLGANQDFVGVYTDSTGVQTTVTSCSWSATGSASGNLSATSEGTQLSAVTLGTGTVVCNYTPSGGPTYVGQANVTVSSSTRIAEIAPSIGHPVAVVIVTGSTQSVTSWWSN